MRYAQLPVIGKRIVDNRGYKMNANVVVFENSMGFFNDEDVSWSSTDWLVDNFLPDRSGNKLSFPKMFRTEKPKPIIAKKKELKIIDAVAVVPEKSWYEIEMERRAAQRFKDGEYVKQKIRSWPLSDVVKIKCLEVVELFENNKYSQDHMIKTIEFIIKNSWT